MCARSRATGDGVHAGGELPVLWQSAADDNPGPWDCEPPPFYGRDRPAVEMRPLRTLLMEDDLEAKERIRSAICMTPTEVYCVATVAAGLSSLAHDFFDVIVLDRHLGGWISAQTCRDLVAIAGGKPTVGLINEDCVLDIQDAIEARLTGVYYKDEMNVHLMRRLGRLAYLPSVDAYLLQKSAIGAARPTVTYDEQDLCTQHQDA